MISSSLELTRPTTCPVALCQRCQPWNGIDIHDLGPKYYSGLPTKSSVSIEQLRIIVRKEDPNLVTSVGSPSNLCHGENNSHLELAEPLLDMTPQFRMVYVNTSKPFLCRIEDWEIPYFNVDVLKGWLRHCEHDHGDQCKGTMDTEKTSVATIQHSLSPTDLPRGFRVICTREWKVIQPRDRVRYVALSYMWNNGTDGDVQLETKNISALESPGGFSRLQIPQIIRDAIALCQQLDEPYLWVDRFCIVQDDPGSKFEQIKAMDKIYRSATLTIVAALNTRDAVGLPGFTGCPRHPRSSALRPPLVLDVETRGFSNSFGITHLIEEYINSTLWNKRGWTFQERLLSNRCLYITEFQVIFECSVERGFEIFTWAPPRVGSDSGTTPGHGIKQLLENIKPRCLEATASSYIGSSCVQIGDAFGDSSIDVNINKKLTVNHYKSWVGDFTSRQLSYKRYILNAFEGLANVLAGSFGNTAMLFGLPEIYLADCLLWRTARISGYRAETPEIPSWSWGSSSEAVHYIRNEQMASIVIFHYQDPDCGKLRKLNVQEQWLRVIISIEALAKQNDLPQSPGLRYLPSDQRTSRDWKECPHNSWQAVAHEVSLDGDACAVAGQYPGSLVFNTTIASMKVGHLAPGLDDPHNPNYDAVLFNMNGDRVGQLFGREETWEGAGGDTRPCDILVLSGGMGRKSARRDLCFVEQFGDLWFLNVMLVEMLPYKPFVARRIAVGTVVMSKWRDCNPRWETVVLI